MFVAYLGHLAALGTSVAWSFTSVLFTPEGGVEGRAAAAVRDGRKKMR